MSRSCIPPPTNMLAFNKTMTTVAESSIATILLDWKNYVQSICENWQLIFCVCIYKAYYMRVVFSCECGVAIADNSICAVRT